LKQFTLSLVLTLCSINLTFAQINFYKTYNSALLRDVVKTYDNGFACLTSHGEILKLDNTTHATFCRKIDPVTTWIFNKIIQTTDSGYIIGTLKNVLPNSTIGYLSKFDKNGNQVWSKRYYHPVASVNSLTDIISTDNNGFFILTQGCDLTTLIKCNGTGDIIWQKKFNVSTPCGKLLRYSRDKIIIFGQNPLSNNLFRVVVYLVDGNGNFLWQKEYENGRVNYLVDVMKEKNNEYSILVNLTDNNSSVLNMKSVKIHIDSLGNILSSKRIYTNDTVNYTRMESFVKTYDKGYLYTGLLSFPDNGSDNHVIYIKTDSSDHVEWSRFFVDQFGIKIIPANNDNYIFADGNSGLSVTKLDSYGYGFCEYDSIQYNTGNESYGTYFITNYTTDAGFAVETANLVYNTKIIQEDLVCLNTNTNSTDETNIKKGIICYPNPASENFTVEGENIQHISLVNLKGIEVRKIITGDRNKAIIDISDLPEGVYLIKVNTAKTTDVEKVIIIN